MDGADRAERYARDVLDGSVDAPHLVRLACKRFVGDKERPDLVFSERAVNAAVENIECLPHVKGRWAGKPIELEDWQCFVIANIFGFRWEETGTRRYRYAYIQIPRKNGKTMLAVCIALQMFAADQEEGAEVYLGATAQDHAKQLLFLPAKRIVDRAKDFSEFWGIESGASALVIPETFSRLTTVIRKPDDGANPHCAVVDEYHEHDTDDQWATFDTGMGAREQPLLLTTTTAGSNLSGPCKEYRDECGRILDGSLPGDSTFALIYEPDKDDDWDDPAVLRKVNPNMDVSVSGKFLLDQLERARASAARQNAYRTKHLNQWVGAKVAWMNMLAWQRQKRRANLEDYRRRTAFLGIDLASKKDVTAISAVLPLDGGEWQTFQWFFAPEGAAEENDKYRNLSTGGWLTLTPGNATDFGEVEEKIAELASFFDVQGAAFDQWQAQNLAQRLQERGLPMVEFPHQVRTMSDPMKSLESLVLDRKLWHDGNEAMTWMMGEVMARADAKDNVYPTKSRPNDPRCKIDGPVATIMALGLALRHVDEPDLDQWLSDPVVL